MDIAAAATFELDEAASHQKKKERAQHYFYLLLSQVISTSH